MKIVKNKKTPAEIYRKPVVSKEISENRFWEQLALQQQALLHAKHNT